MQPALTIAIPTWNRGAILGKALGELLPQVEKHAARIQVVVSDNGSTDNTPAVIKGFKDRFPAVQFVHFTQPENTGYYGNFRKCRELSDGKYIWLLSDNDLAGPGIVDEIMRSIDTGAAFIFLADLGLYKDLGKKKPSYKAERYDISDAIKKFGYDTTLISSVICRNDKSDDEEIFASFLDNTFLGYVFFLKSLTAAPFAIAIRGKSLFVHDARVSFNAMQSFTQHLKKCFEFAGKKGYISRQTEEVIMNDAIRRNTMGHYMRFRLTGKLYGMNIGTKETIDGLINDYLSGYEGYQRYLRKVMDANAAIVLYYYMRLKVLPYVKKRVFG